MEIVLMENETPDDEATNLAAVHPDLDLVKVKKKSWGSGKMDEYATSPSASQAARLAELLMDTSGTDQPGKSCAQPEMPRDGRRSWINPGPLRLQSSTILVSGILTLELTVQTYRLLCHRIAVDLHLMPDFAKLTTYSEHLMENILFPDENITDVTQSTCCVLTFWEPVIFSPIGNGITEWPWIFRLPPKPDTPEGHIRKSLLGIAVRDDIEGFLGDAEIMAARGFPIDPSGAATGAIASLFMQYLRSVYAQDIALILLLKSSKINTLAQNALVQERPDPKGGSVPQTKRDKGKKKGKGRQQDRGGESTAASAGGQGPRQVEIFALVFLRNGSPRQPALNDFALSVLGRHRALQPLGPWILQISRSYANLKFANPEPIIKDYYIHRIVGFQPGVELQQIEQALLANPENHLQGVVVYMDRAFLRTESPQSTRASGDHLICIYRDAACPINIPRRPGRVGAMYVQRCVGHQRRGRTSPWVGDYAHLL